MNLNNPMRSAMRAGKKARVAQMTTNSTIIAETLSSLGWEGICFDMQHGEIGPESIVPLLQAASGYETTSVVRVPWNDPALVMRVLDAGALGVICPLVNNRAEAEQFVSAALYPPAGIRSFGPLRAGISHGAKPYAAVANDEVLTFAMIETKDAVDNLEEIISVPGLSGVYVGPADLSRALGGEYGADWPSGAVRDVIDDVLRLSARHQKFAGIYCDSPEYAQEMLKIGFTYAIVESEVGFVRGRSIAALALLD